MENTTKKEKQCYFCANNIDDIDYKDTSILRRFISSYMRILPPKKHGTCSWHQRKLAVAVKRARMMALLPFVR
jgi:small subunit ribosomal protein S18